MDRRIRHNHAIHVRGMHGLGDNIMQRPFIRAAAQIQDVYLETPWPELYADLANVYPVRANSTLRTQAKNEAASQIQWHRPRGRRVRLQYGPRDLATKNIWRALDRNLPIGVQSFALDLPPLPIPPINTGGKPLAIVRPVTARSEWLNAARNPLPEYVNAIAAELSLTHFVVCLADLQDKAEWLVGEMPFCDLALVRGELTTLQALALVGSADVVVGGVGWIVPAALAYRTPAFIVLGGMGAHNAPERLIDPRWVDSSRMGFAVPANYCVCDQKNHNCDKHIPDIDGQFLDWCIRQQVPICEETIRLHLSNTPQTA